MGAAVVFRSADAAFAALPDPGSIRSWKALPAGAPSNGDEARS
jgi:hypothetical protein